MSIGNTTTELTCFGLERWDSVRMDGGIVDRNIEWIARKRWGEEHVRAVRKSRVEERVELKR